MTAHTFKKALANVFRVWADNDYNVALEEADKLLKMWPGNAQLQIVRASLIQLQDRPTHTLNDAKRALQEAIDLDQSSPAAALELGHFLDAVEDDPKTAVKFYAKATVEARRLLVEGLIGQAKAFLQLDKKDDALKCLTEALREAEGASVTGPIVSENGPGRLVSSPAGQISALKAKGPSVAEIEQLINEAMTHEGIASP